MTISLHKSLILIIFLFGVHLTLTSCGDSGASPPNPNPTKKVSFSDFSYSESNVNVKPGTAGNSVTPNIEDLGEDISYSYSNANTASPGTVSGITIDSGTGMISWNATTAAGVYTLTVTASLAGETAETTFTLSIVSITDFSYSESSVSVYKGESSNSVAPDISATPNIEDLGEDISYSYSNSNTASPGTVSGITIDSGTGMISWNDSLALGTYTLTVTASLSGATAETTFTLTIISPLDFVEHFRDGVDKVDGLYRVYSVVVSPDGKNVYVASVIDNAVAVFNRNTNTGALTYSTFFRDGEKGVDGLRGASSVTLSPDGKNVYVSGFWDHTVAVFNRNTITGVLTYSTNYIDGKDGVDGLSGANSVVVSPDGKNVYVSGSRKSTLAVFKRDTGTGALTYSTNYRDGVNGVERILYSPTSVTVSPDGENVYVAGFLDRELVVFNRNTGSGALTYSTVFKDGVDQVDGLDGAFSATVSPDGKNVYVASGNDDALAVFNRNTTTGALTYSTNFKDGVDQVDGLDGATSVTVSPDGKNVYAVGESDDAVAVFKRNTETGALIYSTVFKDGVDQVDGLDGAWSVTVSPDNKNVYVAGSLDNALVVFKRN